MSYVITVEGLPTSPIPFPIDNVFVVMAVLLVELDLVFWVRLFVLICLFVKMGSYILPSHPEFIPYVAKNYLECLILLSLYILPSATW